MAGIGMNFAVPPGPRRGYRGHLVVGRMGQPWALAGPRPPLGAADSATLGPTASRLLRNSLLELLPVGTQFQLQRRGVDPRFDGSALWVPAGSLRERASDILTPEALVRLHPGYRNRVLMGPSWRADVWTALERAPGMATADLARQIGCPLAAAGQVAEDFHLWRRATA